MVLPGHLAGGYLVTTALLVLSHAALSPEQVTAIYAIGIIASDLPDIDLFWFRIAGRKPHHTESHRAYFTHVPAFWLCVSAPIILAGSLIHFEFIYLAGWALLVGTWTHLLLDSVEYGVCWLSPFNKKRFCLTQGREFIHTKPVGGLAYYFEYLINSYIKSVIFYLEVFLVVVAFWVYFK